MLIAQQKRRENIAEYVLYMWQVEDLIRACRMNLDLIAQKIIPQFKQGNETNALIKDWYANLITLMNNEKTQDKGHLQILKEIVNDLNRYHLHLIHNQKDRQYINIGHEAIQIINTFRLKSANESLNDIEAALLLLYGVLMSKIKPTTSTLTSQTEIIAPVSKMLAYLSAYYKKEEKEGN